MIAPIFQKTIFDGLNLSSYALLQAVNCLNDHEALYRKTGQQQRAKKIGKIIDNVHSINSEISKVQEDLVHLHNEMMTEEIQKIRPSERLILSQS